MITNDYEADPDFLPCLSDVFLVACGPKDSRQSFDDPTVYNDFVVDALTELDLTYANALNMNQGQEKCLLMCDSLVFKSEATLKKLEGSSRTKETAHSPWQPGILRST